MSCRVLPLLSLLALLIFASACQRQEEPGKPSGQAVAPETTGTKADMPQAGDRASTESAPPAPPLREDFEGEPKLSLFPRVGDFRPEDDNAEGLSYWNTYIDHLLRTSGVLANKDKAKGHVFAFRGIKAIDSVGFFSPLAVMPDTSYRVSLRLWTSLADGGRAGVGILEFDEFLWVAGQYPKSLSERHSLGAQIGIEFTGRHEGDTQGFTFRTGPQTRMIHLIFFREGAHDREPVILDDIDIRVE